VLVCLLTAASVVAQQGDAARQAAVNANMTEKDLITLCFSGLALIVSIYGILERGFATRRAFRIRLTELIDDLVRIEGDQQVYEQDASKSDVMKDALRQGNATRRALLGAQALDILSKYRRRITIPEYVGLASALRETSDTAGQRRVLEEAIASLEKETPFQQAAAYRVWAYFNFAQGNFDTARKAVRRSIEVRPAIDDVSRNEVLVTLFAWFDYEFKKNPTDSAQWSRILDDAEAVAKTIDDDEWRASATQSLARARARSRGEEN
jgi:hypothetical protein